MSYCKLGIGGWVGGSYLCLVQLITIRILTVDAAAEGVVGAIVVDHELLQVTGAFPSESFGCDVLEHCDELVLGHALGACFCVVSQHRYGMSE